MYGYSDVTYLLLMVLQCGKSRHSHRHGGTSTYTQLAEDMGERQKAAKEAARALLAKVPCEGKKVERKENKESADAEPEWFQSAMRRVSTL